MKNDSPVKKHHFWLLFGVVPLFTLIGVSCVSSGVGGKIAEREKEIDAAKSAIAGKQNPKPKTLIDKAGSLVETVSSKQGDLHKVNWDRQKGLYTWPTGSPRLLKKFEQANLKFGDQLTSNEGEFDEFKKSSVYIYEFSSIKKDGTGAPGTGMADRIAPTQFRGGWEKVLRHVNDFGQAQITKDQVWLMMEDIWVQRSMLEAVRSINVDMSTFRRAKIDKDGNVGYDQSYDEAGYKIATDPATGSPVVKDGKYVRTATPDDEKKKAVFRNRIWSVELELVRDGGSQKLIGTLTNQSERLQLLGSGNVMTLNVWFSKEPTAPPLVFKIGGEFLPGKGALKPGTNTPANVLPIVSTDDHILPAAMSADEIVRVEQVFDIRTVPVKRIEALALGFRDSRSADKPLLQPKFIKEEAAPDAGGGGVGGGDMGGRPGGGGLGPPPMGGGGPGPMGGSGGNNATKGLLMGGGYITAAIDGNKKRYLEVTDQVRRMPVGIVVVVDQAYMQDMLLAFANSPLRFQITQVNWTRFRGTLTGIGAVSSSGDGPGGGINYGEGSINIGGAGDPDGPRGGGSSMGPRPTGPISPVGPIGPGGPMGPMGPMGSGYPGAGPSSTVSESQITAGLVELSIYGVVSLYEKYDAPKPPDAAPKTPDATPGPMTPGPMTPDPKAPGPMPPAPGPAVPEKKMRRRVRA